MTDQISPTRHAALKPYPLAADLPGHPTKLASDLTGDWRYEVDSPQITYGQGLWPYYRHGKPTAVRLSPDIAYRAWQDHYVTANPVGDDQVQLVLFCHDRGDDNRAVKVYARVDLRLRLVVLPPGLPSPLGGQGAHQGQEGAGPDRRRMRRP
ncbi:hypothetical protein AB0B66_10400 [Catellatospora sp. NPDC049111]|uniref:hypothetical protein n=1 Tax=Catellatospora sp. NPDC049111 TaxID=3155271 RepID=UPI0033EFD62A